MNTFFREGLTEDKKKALSPPEQKSLIVKDPSLMILNFEDLQDIYLEEKIPLGDYIEDPGANYFNIKICSIDEMIAVFASQAKPAFFAVSNQNPRQTFLSFPIDDPTKIVEMHCPNSNDSRQIKGSYF